MSRIDEYEGSYLFKNENNMIKHKKNKFEYFDRDTNKINKTNDSLTDDIKLSKINKFKDFAKINMLCKKSLDCNFIDDGLNIHVFNNSLYNLIDSSNEVKDEYYENNPEITQNIYLNKFNSNYNLKNKHNYINSDLTNTDQPIYFSNTLGKSSIKMDSNLSSNRELDNKHKNKACNNNPPSSSYDNSNHKKIGKWSEDEDKILTELVSKYGGKNWKKISAFIPGRSSIQCLHRWTKILQPGLVKGPWTVDEDRKLLEWVRQEGPTKWTQCADFIKGRNGKQCRERWFHTLNPKIIKGNWTCEEDFKIFTLYDKLGGKWAKIAVIICGRTENSIKNRFYSTLRRKASEKLKNTINDKSVKGIYFYINLISKRNSYLII